jgi:O-antigen ligase
VIDRPGLAIQYRLLVVTYIAAVVLLSYRENLTQAAKLAGVLLGLAVVFLVVAKGKQIVVPVTYRIWGVWFFFALVSSVFSRHIDVSMARALTLAQVSGIGFLVTNILIWNRSTRFYAMALIGAALVSIAMVSSMPGVLATGDGRVYGTMGNANGYGVMLSVAMVLSLITALDARNIFIKVVFFGATIPIASMMLQTGSRKAMIAGLLLGGGLICIAYLYKSGAATFRSFFVAMIIVSALVLGGITFLVNSDHWSRTEQAMAAADGDFGDADQSVIGRLWLAQQAIELSMKNPLLGIGLDAFRMARSSTTGMTIGTYSHSNYLEVLVSTGIVGFFLFFSIYWLWFRRIYAYRGHMRSPASFRRYTMVMVVVMMVAAMDVAMVSYYDKFMWLVLPWVVAELYLFEQEEIRRIATRKAEAASAEAEASGAEVAELVVRDSSGLRSQS